MTYVKVSGSLLINDAFPDGYYGRVNLGFGIPGYTLDTLRISGSFWTVPDTASASLLR